MMDYAFHAIQQRMLAVTAAQRVLWVVDENLGASDISTVSCAGSLAALTNRVDIYRALTQQGINTFLNDYEFGCCPPKSLDAIFYRVSKEKAIVHHVINSAATALKPGGVLFLAGYKNEGIKTYVTKAANYLSGSLEKHRGDLGSMLAAIYCAEISGAPLDDKHYSRCRSLDADGVSFITKPGVYGWNKIDKGSAFLISHLGEFLAGLESQPRTIADLGCGYGYLSVMASCMLEADFYATDNSVGAVKLCNENFKKFAVNGQVLLDDCAASLTAEVELVLCNPPFHQGFSVDGQLTNKFLQAAARVLTRGGVALFVVNSFIGLEKKAAGLFAEVSVLANNGSFKLVALKAY